MTPTSSIPRPVGERSIATRIVTLGLIVALALSACGVRSAADNRIEGADGTDESVADGEGGGATDDEPQSTPTATAFEIPTIVAPSINADQGADDDGSGDDGEADEDGIGDEDEAGDAGGKASAVTPTPTPPPIPRLTPSPTVTPTAAVVPSPTAAPGTRPAPTATRVAPTPTRVPPTATATPAPLPEVSCSITPNRVVSVGESLVFRAKSWPANAAVDYVFDHGDGTLDPGPVSNAYYREPGTYTVRLQWSHASGNGVAPCGQVQVSASEPNCHIGLGPADGLGWWCGDVFCRDGAPNPAPICPTVPPYGCYTGMDGRTYCIDPPGTTKVSCSISKRSPIKVDETVQFRATHQSGSIPTISFEFDHGDGTRDPGAVSNAYYAAAGTYQVKLRWQTATDSGIVNCGTVTVVSDKPVCLVGQGPADGTAWICDGKWCNPASPFAGCPPYPIYGCHPTVEGPTICIDPAPQPVVNCSISKTSVQVGEVLTFTAVQTGSRVPVDFAFNHGDGTIDRQRVSQAYYEAAGTYAVSLTWSWANGGATINCGTVTVT